MLKKAIRLILGKAKEPKLGIPDEPPIFTEQTDTKIKTRSYESYDQYLTHQKKKLERVYGAVKEYDQQYEAIVFDRYKSFHNLQGRSILCVAARLGGEVRAFRRLGALAIGIDIEPGPENLHVLHGDFHNLQFADSCFDFVFCNAIDHVYDIKAFSSEISRVLKTNGELILEICTKKPGMYEAIDLSENLEPVLSILKNFFDVTYEKALENSTSFVQWDGLLVFLSKKTEAV